MSRSRRRKGYVCPAGLSLGFIETFHVLYPVILKVKVGKVIQCPTYAKKNMCRHTGLRLNTLVFLFLLLYSSEETKNSSRLVYTVKLTSLEPVTFGAVML